MKRIYWPLIAAWVCIGILPWDQAAGQTWMGSGVEWRVKDSLFADIIFPDDSTKITLPLPLFLKQVLRADTIRDNGAGYVLFPTGFISSSASAVRSMFTLDSSLTWRFGANEKWDIRRSSTGGGDTLLFLKAGSGSAVDTVVMSLVGGSDPGGSLTDAQYFKGPTKLQLNGLYNNGGGDSRWGQVQLVLNAYANRNAHIIFSEDGVTKWDIFNRQTADVGYNDALYFIASTDSAFIMRTDGVFEVDSIKTHRLIGASRLEMLQNEIDTVGLGMFSIWTRNSGLGGGSGADTLLIGRLAAEPAGQYEGKRILEIFSGELRLKNLRSSHLANQSARIKLIGSDSSWQTLEFGEIDSTGASAGTFDDIWYISHEPTNDSLIFQARLGTASGAGLALAQDGGGKVSGKGAWSIPGRFQLDSNLVIGDSSPDNDTLIVYGTIRGTNIASFDTNMTVGDSLQTAQLRVTGLAAVDSNLTIGNAGGDADTLTVYGPIRLGLGAAGTAVVGLIDSVETVVSATYVAKIAVDDSIRDVMRLTILDSLSSPKLTVLKTAVDDSIKAVAARGLDSLSLIWPSRKWKTLSFTDFFADSGWVPNNTKDSITVTATRCSLTAVTSGVDPAGDWFPGMEAKGDSGTIHLGALHYIDLFSDILESPPGYAGVDSIMFWCATGAGADTAKLDLEIYKWNDGTLSSIATYAGVAWWNPSNPINNYFSDADVNGTLAIGEIGRYDKFVIRVRPYSRDNRYFVRFAAQIRWRSQP